MGRARLRPWPVLRRTARRFGRRLPEGPLARTRWTFAAFALSITALATLALPAASTAAPPLRLAALAGLVWIAARDLRLLRTGRPSPALITVDALALLAVALGAGPPSTGVLFTGAFFRSLYGDRRHVAATALTASGALAASATLGGQAAALAPTVALSQIPGLVLTAPSWASWPTRCARRTAPAAANGACATRPPSSSPRPTATPCTPPP